MDYGKILMRAFEVTRKYRALWLFGILLALFGGSRGGSFNFGGFNGDGTRGGQIPGRGDFPMPELSAGVWQAIAIVIVALLCFALAWILLSLILRFVSRAALIGLTQELEASGAVPTVKRGFIIGAERFWPLLGIALTINVPLTLVSLGLMIIAVLPLIVSLMPLIGSSRRGGEVVGLAIAGIAGSIGLICCAAIVLMAVSFVIAPIYEFVARACVIGKRGVMDSLREGYRLVRANVGGVLVLYLLIIGLSIGYSLLMIPVVLILMALIAGVAFFGYVLANSITGALIAGILPAIPVMLLLLFIGGLFQTFESVMWTEGYLAVAIPPVRAPAAATEIATSSPAATAALPAETNDHSRD